MANQYARSFQLARGNTLEARDLQAGDVVLIRSEGESERTPHSIEVITAHGADIAAHFTDGTGHFFSPKMPIEVQL